MSAITRRTSLAAGAALLAMPSNAMADVAQVALDPVLHWFRVSSLALRRLMDLDVAGRSQMAFMRGHMAEIMKDTKAQAYFDRFYTPVGKEFVQYDDYSFVLHHALRVLYVHWKEENELLRAGPLGAALQGIGGALPDMRERPASPTRRPDAVKANWYAEVYEDLSKGKPPVPKGAQNEALRPDQCVLGGKDGLDLIWASFLVYACDVWARQIPLVWELVGSSIAARKIVDQMSKSDIDRAIAARTDDYKNSSLEYAKLFSDWQNYHADTVDIHDPMFDRVVGGLGSWLKTLTSDLGAWTIKPAMKDEMYGEVAAAVLSLRGTPTAVRLPDMRYWRTLHFAPRSNRIGAPGMPPFDRSYFAADKNRAAEL
ncbi:hypothetical protein [Beijerinckia sp. L45]|uniref:hypothetical protein n=1 Tax=Beijerinckia sp. L45 TaxID=1641855 RepID=UPI00131D3723|nr:hypothetical protein [Beijerinckia sp. L45]